MDNEQILNVKEQINLKISNIIKSDCFKFDAGYELNRFLYKEKINSHTFEMCKKIRNHFFDDIIIFLNSNIFSFEKEIKLFLTIENSIQETIDTNIKLLNKIFEKELYYLYGFEFSLKPDSYIGVIINEPCKTDDSITVITFNLILKRKINFNYEQKSEFNKILIDLHDIDVFNQNDDSVIESFIRYDTFNMKSYNLLDKLKEIKNNIHSELIAKFINYSSIKTYFNFKTDEFNTNNICNAEEYASRIKQLLNIYLTNELYFFNNLKINVIVNKTDIRNVTIVKQFYHLFSSFEYEDILSFAKYQVTIEITK